MLPDVHGPLRHRRLVAIAAAPVVVLRLVRRLLLVVVLIALAPVAVTLLAVLIPVVTVVAVTILAMIAVAALTVLAILILRTIIAVVAITTIVPVAIAAVLLVPVLAIAAMLLPAVLAAVLLMAIPVGLRRLTGGGPAFALRHRLVREAGNRRLLALPEIFYDGRAIVIPVIVGVDRVHVGPKARLAGIAAATLAALRHRLLAIGDDDAVVVLCVLEIVLRQHRIPRRLSVASQRNILFCNMCGRSTHFYVRAVGFEAPRERVLTLAMIVAVIIVVVVVTTAATTMLLSLPHGLPFSR